MIVERSASTENARSLASSSAKATMRWYKSLFSQSKPSLPLRSPSSCWVTCIPSTSSRRSFSRAENCRCLPEFAQDVENLTLVGGKGLQDGERFLIAHDHHLYRRSEIVPHELAGLGEDAVAVEGVEVFVVHVEHDVDRLNLGSVIRLDALLPVFAIGSGSCSTGRYSRYTSRVYTAKLVTGFSSPSWNAEVLRVRSVTGSPDPPVTLATTLTTVSSNSSIKVSPPIGRICDADYLV